MPDRTTRENLMLIGKVAFVLRWVGHSRGLKEAGTMSFLLSKLNRFFMRRGFVFKDWSRKDTTLMQMVGAHVNGFEGDKAVLRGILCEVGMMLDEIHLDGLHMLCTGTTCPSVDELTESMMDRKRSRERMLRLVRLLLRASDPWDVYEDFLRGNIGISINDYDQHTYLAYHKVLTYIREHVTKQ